MRTVLIAFAVAAIFSACKSNTESNKNVVGLDTSGIYKNNVLADSAKTEATLPAGVTKKIVETRSPDGTVTTVTTTSAASKTKTIPGAHTSTTSSTGPVATQTATTTAPAAKKGWSNKAKGAVIGGVGGAVVGAAVSKKKGKGAIIGGVVGAAGGYILGDAKDKKQGR